MFQPSRLVQRLLKPSNRGPNPFSFGGGLRYGGLSEDVARMVAQFFAFDYMGRSEFEHGVVPEALGKLFGWANENQIENWEFELPAKSVYVPKGMGEKYKLHKGPFMMYALAFRGWKEEAEKRIRDIARNGGKDLKESPCIYMAYLDSRKEDRSPVAGWIELDNAFMFFADPEMAKGVSESLFKNGSPLHPQQ